MVSLSLSQVIITSQYCAMQKPYVYLELEQLLSLINSARLNMITSLFSIA